MESEEAIPALRALADQTRLQVARLLVEGPLSVGEIQEVLGLGQSTVSHHLKVLSDAGLCGCRREGRVAWYGWESQLSPARAALKRFVQHHVRALDREAARQLKRVFEARTEHTRRFFNGDPQGAGAPPASVKPPAPAVDVVARMMAAAPQAEVALDLGCGLGRLIGPLRARAPRVVGVDQSPRMLDGARQHAFERGWHDVDFRLGSLEHLPIADREAGLAVAHQVLHHVARPEQALAEAHRALTDGGVLVVADYLPHDREWMREEYADVWLGFDPAFVERLFADAGFVDVRLERRAGRGDQLGMFVAAGRRSEAQPVSVPASKARPVRSGGRTRAAPRRAPPSTARKRQKAKEKTR